MSELKSNSHYPSKRRVSSPADLHFFTPAAASFQPRPYNPSGTAALQSKPPPPARNNSLIHPLPPMDPSPRDPDAFFIHPPFTEFPDAHMHTQGLTYALLAANSDWFLDPNDFITTNGTNIMPYPSQLEPPRGWCPAKKKDLKERGSESWPEGEEPRLRCTFCRRTYAGINAKSMWRRHVFEKHKVPMSNRRDNSERARKTGGKDSKEAHEKENVSVVTRSSKSATGITHRTLSYHAPSTSRSKLRSRRSISGQSYNSALYDRGNDNESVDDDDDNTPVPPTPRITQREFPVLAPAPQLIRPAAKYHSRTSPTPPPDSPQSDGPELTLGSAPQALPPTPERPVIPESPYNPLVTPSFRHSPPRLPSDQPWRFPSPSHPLHSSAREMSLSMVVRGQTSPARVSFNSVSGIEVSPVIIDPRPGKSSVFNTPSVITASKGKDPGADAMFDDRCLGLGLLKSAVKPTPRRLFLSGSLPAPLTDRPGFKRFRQSDESPLGRGPDDRPTRLAKSSLDLSFSNSVLGSSPMRPRRGNPLLDFAIGLGEDPFMNLYDGALDFRKDGNGDDSASPPMSSPEDSPVVRTGKYISALETPSGSSSKMFNGKSTAGLMEAFLLRGSVEDQEDEEEPDSSLLSSPISKERRTLSKEYRSPLSIICRDDAEFIDARPLKKRRRTIGEIE